MSSSVDLAGNRAGVDPEIAIRVSRLGKCYPLYEHPRDRVKQLLFGSERRKYHSEFWALRDVSFEIKRGEVVGIIGRNGSGKSTLLQLICGTLRETEGEVQAVGKIAALLELGAGFNVEFTGRENVFLNAALLGLSRAETQSRLPQIEAFADIGAFIDEPVKTYSSGMFVRLAFAVQACVDPDILIVDEALAVGDVFFRQKCYRRLERLRQNGCTVLLVSHAMGDVEQLCQRAILLEGGRVAFQGSAVEAVKRYYLMNQPAAGPDTSAAVEPVQPQGPESSFGSSEYPWPAPSQRLDIRNLPQVSAGVAKCVGVAVCNRSGEATDVFEQGEEAFFYYEFELFENIGTPLGGLVIYNDKGVIVHGRGTLEYGSAVPSAVLRDSRLRFRQNIQLDLAIGDYTFEVGLATMSEGRFAQRRNMSIEELYANVTRLCHVPAIGHFRVAARTRFESVQLLHHGVANLPGGCTVSVVREQPLDVLEERPAV